MAQIYASIKLPTAIVCGILLENISSLGIFLLQEFAWDLQQFDKCLTKLQVVAACEQLTLFLRNCCYFSTSPTGNALV